jgi:hypothetical protein
MKVQTGGQSSQVLRNAGHVIFVEGGDDDAFDPTVIKSLMGASSLRMEVSAIGACGKVVG